MISTFSRQAVWLGEGNGCWILKLEVEVEVVAKRKRSSIGSILVPCGAV